LCERTNLELASDVLTVEMRLMIPSLERIPTGAGRNP